MTVLSVSRKARKTPMERVFLRRRLRRGKGRGARRHRRTPPLCRKHGDMAQKKSPRCRTLGDTYGPKEPEEDDEEYEKGGGEVVVKIDGNLPNCSDDDNSEVGDD